VSKPVPRHIFEPGTHKHKSDSLTNSLTHSLQGQSPSWEANNFSACQEILRLFWKLKVHCRLHKGPPIPRTCVTFRNELLVLVQPPSWRTIPYRMSATAHSIYSQLPSASGGRLLHPQPENRPCRGDKVIRVVLYGTQTHSMERKLIWGRKFYTLPRSDALSLG
jgi:hypothetical protein